MAAINSAEKAQTLEQCERDLDVAIERLDNLRLDAADDGGAGAHHDDVHPAAAAADEELDEDTVGAVHAPSDGSSDGRKGQWIERFVAAIVSAGSWDDARARAGRLLEDADAFVATACRAERDLALRENGVLKKAVVLQHRLCKEKDAANLELQRQLAACQELARRLDTENYALSMYLKNAQPKPQGGSSTGPFHPEVF